MARIEDGGPAFPTVTHEWPGDAPAGTYVTTGDSSGISVRDYFAAKALQGMLADPEQKGKTVDFAIQAYKYADAMLVARRGLI